MQMNSSRKSWRDYSRRVRHNINTYTVHIYMHDVLLQLLKMRSGWQLARRSSNDCYISIRECMGRARDVQILQLKNENELVQDKCRITLNSHIPIPQLLCMFMYSLPIMTTIYYWPVDTLTVRYRQLQVSSNEEKQQLQDQITQLQNSLPAQQVPTSSSLNNHHQEESHTQNGELKENHTTIYIYTYQQLSDQVL